MRGRRDDDDGGDGDDGVGDCRGRGGDDVASSDDGDGAMGSETRVRTAYMHVCMYIRQIDLKNKPFRSIIYQSIYCVRD